MLNDFESLPKENIKFSFTIKLKENENIDCSSFIYKALELINKNEFEESIMKIIVSINGSNIHYIMIDNIDNLNDINQTMCIAKADSKVNFEVEIGGPELINNLTIQYYSHYFHCNMQNSDQVRRKFQKTFLG
ncbi:Hypothetical_protein [Hexamita inflata]|uniref:Hypothetical_protein n=1 Tax=Hexamita inflata TaxID=28002 RepID=A0AA86Q8A7_9EUKA|nr:Hypothetical protein HINF_LOCUS35559 [Hexamita inflata]